MKSKHESVGQVEEEETKAESVALHREGNNANGEDSDVDSVDSDELDGYQFSQRAQGVIGTLLLKQQTFAMNAKKRNLNPIDKKLNEELASLKLDGAELIKEKMI